MARSLPELIQDAMQSGFADLHVAAIGTIHQYNAATQRAQIKLVTKRPLKTDDGYEFETPPILQDVPVLFFGGGGASITHPLQPGNGVLVVFCDYDEGPWLATGSPGAPGEVRSHSLGRPVAIPGVRPLSGALAHAALSALVLEATSIVLGAAATDFVALATKVATELTAVKTAFDAHTHPYTDTPNGAAVTSPPSAPMPSPGSVAATKVKAI